VFNQQPGTQPGAECVPDLTITKTNAPSSDTAASTLSNGAHLPLFLVMNCLNGFFHDVYTQSLAEVLLLSKNGGAVAVWASSGLTQPEPQVQMDQNVVRLLFSNPSLTLGEAVRNAKSADIDPDVRRTYILFGDPMLRLRTSSKALKSP
jgi:hypothetical protein